MERLFDISVRDARSHGEVRGVATLWLLRADGTVRQEERPLDLYYEQMDPRGPLTRPNFYGSRPTRLRRHAVRTKAEWAAAQASVKASDPRLEASWLGMKPDEAYLLQHGLRLGDYLQGVPAEGDEDLVFGNLPTLSFDLETSTFEPEDEGARILTVGAIYYAAGREERYCLQLGTVDPDGFPGLEGTSVQTFGDIPPNSPRSLLASPTLDPAEAELVLAFERLVQRLDPRLLLGHNIEGFDVHWLVRRSEALLGRRPEWSIGPDGNPKEVFHYEISGAKQSRRTTTLEGRVYFDTFAWSRKQIGAERSYALGALARKYLKDDKEDMPYHLIVPQTLDGPAGRAKVASYCMQDVALCWRYAQARAALPASFAMARQTHLTFRRFHGGTGQLFIYSTFAHFCLQAGVFLPWARRERWPKCSYPGGHVFDVTPGFYGPPAPFDPATDHLDDFDVVLTTDFMSLYPTDEIAHNMCPTTLVDDPDDPSALERWAPDQVWQLPPDSDDPTAHRYTFLLPSVREGIMPAILRHYLALRKTFKGRMGRAQTPAERASMDAAQLAAKTICNTVYGTMGAGLEEGGKLPCLPVAITTTAAGRHYIKQTDQLVRAQFGPMGVERIGGDTDSVLLLCRLRQVRTRPDVWAPHLPSGVSEPTLEQIAVAFGRAMVDWLNPHYPPPMKIELDDIFTRFLYVRKKGYAGSYWQPGPSGGLIPMGMAPKDVKMQGLECKRMDWAPVCAETQWHALRALLELPPHPTPTVNPPPAIHAAGYEAILRWAATGIARNLFPVGAYRIEAELTKEPEEYAGTPPPHVRVALKMRAKGIPARRRERIGYILVVKEKSKGERQHRQKPCIPEDVERKGLPIDRRHYFENFFAPLITRTFSLVCGEEALSQLLMDATRMWKKAPPPLVGPFAAFRK